jgi:hypothetical protein
VDRAAKAAATSSTILPTSRTKSAQNRSIHSMIETKLETEWKMGKENARRLRNTSQYPGTTTGLKLYEILKRKCVTPVARLHTGHCHLNEYIYRFDIIKTSECRKRNDRSLSLNLKLYDKKETA